MLVPVLASNSTAVASATDKAAMVVPVLSVETLIAPAAVVTAAAEGAVKFVAVSARL